MGNTGPLNARPEKLRADGDVDGLLRALRREADQEARQRLIRALGETGSSKAVGFLIDLLGWEDWRGRGVIVRALVNIGEPAVEPLVLALHKGDSRLKENAARILGEIGDRRAVEPLIAELADEDVREVAAEALGRIGDPIAVEPLIRAIGPRCKIQVAGALGGFQDRRAIEPLIAAMDDSNHYTRRMVAEALGHMGEPALEPLATALGDKKRKPSIRQGAAWALGDMKSVMARDALVAALGDEDGDVRDAAADALASIGDDQSHSTADRSVGE